MPKCLQEIFLTGSAQQCEPREADGEKFAGLKKNRCMRVCSANAHLLSQLSKRFSGYSNHALFANSDRKFRNTNHWYFPQPLGWENSFNVKLGESTYESKDIFVHWLFLTVNQVICTWHKSWGNKLLLVLQPPTMELACVLAKSFI